MLYDISFEVEFRQISISKPGEAIENYQCNQ